ncbi:methyl-accepting chemotaxis protein [Cupriavidus necator]|uniref:Methyl-accepting chemotaxis protein n=1 Tax=Cupriavidus necator TaxID=106590 RepID=A0A367PG31_CUPNE|nr:methyl-accepting chemotaxis protein [Cupriavidus necator]QQX86661.1 methyl-accepting chemotaxis protein [Cupriavidus necator]RCJ06851.1 methyl-accepting chemotaxis protein [Cupriavidus necator]
MKYWTIRARILASFALILLIMALMGFVAFNRLSAIQRESDTMKKDALSGLHFSTAMRATWSELYVLGWQAMLASSDEERQRFFGLTREAKQRLNALEHSYEATIGRDDDAVKRLDAYKAIRDKFDQPSRMFSESNAWAGSAAAQAALLGPLHIAWVEGRKAAQTLVDNSNSKADHAAAAISRSVDLAMISIAVSLLVAAIAAAICGHLLLRTITVPMQGIVGLLANLRGGDLRQRLELNREDEFLAVEQGFNQMAGDLTGLIEHTQRSAIHVTTSVNQIAATARQQQATAEQTSASATEISATSLQISATARDLVRTMAEVSSTAEQTAGLAGNSQVILTHMDASMDHVLETAASVHAQLANLNEKASNISQVVTTIAKVADQANLLSLNAAIEAEKAADLGRGFTVVAIEIRRLADQTAVATYDIKQIVCEMLSAVATGVMSMDKFIEEVRRRMADGRQVRDQMSQIIGRVQSLAPRVQTVHEGVQAQAGGARQINQALTQLSEAARQTVESLRQSNEAIGQLTLVANDLRAGVSRFQV